MIQEVYSSHYTFAFIFYISVNILIYWPSFILLYSINVKNILKCVCVCFTKKSFFFFTLVVLCPCCTRVGAFAHPCMVHLFAKTTQHTTSQQAQTSCPQLCRCLSGASRCVSATCAHSPAGCHAVCKMWFPGNAHPRAFLSPWQETVNARGLYSSLM